MPLNADEMHSLLCSEVYVISFTAPILLDDLECRYADRFEDCIHNGWGVHDCDSDDSVGLICNPGPSGFTICATCALHLQA